MSSNQLIQQQGWNIAQESHLVSLQPLSHPANAVALKTKRILNQVTLHQLRVFETVARFSSFTRAARDLNLTQPTVSMQVKQLTDTIGVPLFDQIGKRIFLTDAGRELLVSCQAITAELSQFEMRIADLKGMQQGHLRIAAISPINTLVSRLLNPFCDRYPGINVSLDIMNSEQILRRLSENRDDLYLTCEPLNNPGVCSQPFVQNPLVVVAHPSHPMAVQSHLSIECLRGEAVIMREIGSATRQSVQSVLDQHKVSVRVQFEVGNNEAIKQMVMLGMGISVLSRHMVDDEVANGQLAILNVEGFPIHRNWYVIYASGKKLSIVANTFLQFLSHSIHDSAALAA
ncbi:MAG: LysR family transcriptional regulator [Leptolyngbya sp. Prado105]|jgi:DNA-binding transcriptional LysR family regulator|nr:LysR family transcriptional regulator [Leptolyngbya sp. Prado105]